MQPAVCAQALPVSKLSKIVILLTSITNYYIYNFEHVDCNVHDGGRNGVLGISYCHWSPIRCVSAFFQPFLMENDQHYVIRYIFP